MPQIVPTSINSAFIREIEVHAKLPQRWSSLEPSDWVDDMPALHKTRLCGWVIGASLPQFCRLQDLVGPSHRDRLLCAIELFCRTFGIIVKELWLTLSSIVSFEAQGGIVWPNSGDVLQD